MIFRPLLLFTLGHLIFLWNGAVYAENPLPGRIVPDRIKVVVTKARGHEESTTIDSMGTINYVAKTDVSAEINGVLRSVNVEVGDKVEKGQILADIDSTLLQAELKKAVSAQEMAEIKRLQWDNQLKIAQFEFESAEFQKKKIADQLAKKQELFSIGAITQSELDEVEIRYQKALAEYRKALEDLQALKTESDNGRISSEAALIHAKAETEEVRARLDKCTIKAPMAGVVVAKKKWAGERVGPGDFVIVTLIDIDRVYAESELNEKYLSAVKSGQKAAVAVDAYPGEVFQGKIDKIGPIVDRNSRTFMIKVELNNHNSILKPGMFARLTVVMARSAPYVTVPKEAVVRTKDGHTVAYAVIDGVAFERRVRTGPQHGDRITILKGIKSGERVVIDGFEGLTDLTSVTPSEMESK